MAENTCAECIHLGERVWHMVVPWQKCRQNWSSAGELATQGGFGFEARLHAVIAMKEWVLPIYEACGEFAPKEG